MQPAVSNQDVSLLLLETVKKPCALVVDKIIKPLEIVIKPLGEPLHDVKSFLGATLLGDGRVIPVLDLAHILDEQVDVKTKPKTNPVIKENLSVMIVDDSPSVRHVNSTLVKNNNWEPIVAKDGMEALEILNCSSKLPDIILTDVEMPEMDGYELLSTLKQSETFRDIPVVMITSRASDKHRRKAFDLGVLDYITKPYDDAKLIGIIKSLND
jgi:chemosensory pili system protein ChpA (sensor histidine kinase/response regulator)